MKVAWVACFGPQPELDEALVRLEVIADTFLSMNAAIQWALPELLAGRAQIQEQIRARTKRNLQVLDEIFPRGSQVVRLAAEGGWYAEFLRIPATVPDEETVFKLLEEAGVAVHSGDFFGFGDSGYGWIVSLLPDEGELFQWNQQDCPAIFEE